MVERVRADPPVIPGSVAIGYRSGCLSRPHKALELTATGRASVGPMYIPPMSIAGREHEVPADQPSAVAAMLIDYDNIEVLRNAPSAERFAYVLGQLIDAHLAIIGDAPERLLVRLYGGWDEAGTLTQRASQVAQYIANADPFPLIFNGRTMPGTLELALGPFDRPGLLLPNTYRRRNGSIRVRRDPALSHPSCPNDANCAAKQLAKWTNKATRLCPTQDCEVSSAEAFLVSEQKMIDTLLATDLLGMFHVDRYSSVSVVSDDSDFVPPLIHVAHRFHAQQVLLITSSDWDEDLTRILLSSSVQVRGIDL